MAAYDFKKKEEVEEYLKNLYIEYQFGCLSEKKPEVCHLLGDYYESIKQNPKEALNVYKKNCDERGYGRSCTKYGDYRVMGTECEKDPKEAFKYMQKGCDKDDARGCLHAGALAISQEKLEPVRGTQILLGTKLLKKACDLNQEKACFFLSGIYLSGIEGYVEKNLKEAYKLSLKCCELNNPYACANLSIMHKKGDGVQQNAELAETFRTRANEILRDLKEIPRRTAFLSSCNINALLTASGSTAYRRPTGSSGADSPWRWLCFGSDSPMPFFSFIANGTFFKLV